ncbi:STAS domain-containing protein [Salinactinospora qingdaonensis]|uniref:Anti-sigma factor antagonist n=1 Tax=Salinactinospora qingdaonensis TaxID=702744 RepID=A0ABP7EWZ3_9ACTN
MALLSQTTVYACSCGGQGAAGPLYVLVVDAAPEPPYVHVTGELDLATADELADELIGVIERHGPDTVVDLSGVTFCDARGLAALVRVANHAENAGGRLVIASLSPCVARLLRLTGLAWRFTQGRERSVTGLPPQRGLPMPEERNRPGAGSRD